MGLAVSQMCALQAQDQSLTPEPIFWEYGGSQMHPSGGYAGKPGAGYAGYEGKTGGSLGSRAS